MPKLKKTTPFIYASLMGVVSLCLFILIAYQNYNTLESTIKSVAARRTFSEAMLASQNTLTQLKDIETGQRGYAITGEERFLEPYYSGVANLPDAVDELDEKIGRIPDIANELAKIHEQIDSLSIISAKAVVERQTKGLVQAKSLAGDGKSVMDDLRASFRDLDLQLLEKINVARAKVTEDQKRAVWQTLLLIGIGALLLIAAFTRLYIEQQKRLKLEQVLLDVNQKLEETVSERTAELEQAREDLFRFASEMASSIENERSRLSREVHDQLGQVFTAIKMSFSTLDKSKYQELLGKEFEIMNTNLDHGVAISRRIAADLRPPMLDDLGLGAAILHHCQQYAATSGLKFDVNVRHDAALSLMQCTQLFRIAQEAVTNVMRHANATQVKVTDQLEDHQYCLQIDDNGQGLKPKTDERISLGTLGMRERALIAGGELSIDSNPEGGVRVSVVLNLKNKKADS